MARDVSQPRVMPIICCIFRFGPMAELTTAISWLSLYSCMGIASKLCPHFLAGCLAASSALLYLLVFEQPAQSACMASQAHY